MLGLENQRVSNGTVGSNPTLSAANILLHYGTIEYQYARCP